MIGHTLNNNTDIISRPPLSHKNHNSTIRASALTNSTASHHNQLRSTGSSEISNEDKGSCAEEKGRETQRATSFLSLSRRNMIHSPSHPPAILYLGPTVVLSRPSGLTRKWGVIKCPGLTLTNEIHLGVVLRHLPTRHSRVRHDGLQSFHEGVTAVGIFNAWMTRHSRPGTQKII